jgi:hypothetical protein
MTNADSTLHASLSPVEDIEHIVFNSILTLLNMAHFYFLSCTKK